jgi:hypothetical protein
MFALLQFSAVRPPMGCVFGLAKVLSNVPNIAAASVRRLYIDVYPSHGQAGSSTFGRCIPYAPSVTIGPHIIKEVRGRGQPS